MRYSFFLGNNSEAFIYFNDSEESVKNIRATRDSLGNLILKFNLNDLMVFEESLWPDEDNLVYVVVVTTTSEDEYSGDDSVYIVDKKAPERNPRSRTR